MEFKVKELSIENDKRMKIILKINVQEKKVIIEGHYKIKLDGTSTFKLLSTREFRFNGQDNETFNRLIEDVYRDVLEKVEFSETIMKAFENVDVLEIKNIN